MSTKQWKEDHHDDMCRWRREHYQRNKKYYIGRVQNRRQEIRDFIAQLKTKLKCARCPEDDPCCLDFHHEDPKQKDIAVSQIFKKGWSLKRVEEEIEKCTVLCANCHRKEHAQQRKAASVSGSMIGSNPVGGGSNPSWPAKGFVV